MKKTVFIICFLTVITFFSFPCHAYEVTIKQPPKIETTKLPENSKEIIYRDMAISMLIPHIQKEINNYYKDYLNELPVVFPYSIDIVSAKRKGGGGYLIQLEVIAHPFIGPINIVGDDRLIIETGAFGSVNIKDFQHMKSYPLPLNYQYSSF